MDTAIASELLDAILAAEVSLVVLRCTDVPPLLEMLRRHAIRTGQALYAWSEDAGLSSLRDPQVTVAGSQRFADALRHVIQSAHYGIYFFTDPPQAVDASLLPLVRQVARLTGEHTRRVVLVGTGIELPSNIEALELDSDAMTPARPRLRDGHWVSDER